MFIATSSNDFSIVPKTGLWVLSFGEIDVRCLIYNQIHEKGREEDEVINTLVDNYVSRLFSLHKDIAILSIVPPIDFFTGGYQSNKNCSLFPFIGPDECRVRYTKKMNDRLKKNCQEKGLVFVDIYSPYVDDKGFLNKESSDGAIHIMKKGLAFEAMQKVGIY